ncbi:MAG: PilZ domain-containing protein [Vulcanimicrobiaceae bacterium]
MLWSSRRVASTTRTNQRQTYRQSIELPIAVSVNGLPAPVYATLINISETGCRVRSLILIDRNRTVEFELHRQARPPLQLRGKVMSRVTPSGGGGYEYGISFNGLPLSERDALTKEILELQRREAASRAQQRATQPTPPATASGQRRRSVRTLFSFPVRYRLGKSSSPAEANDISTGGLRLMCQEDVPLDTAVEIQFTLPSAVLDIFPPSEERTEITPFGPRKIRLPDNRRPFAEMRLRGRIVSRFAPLRGLEVYGVRFTDIDGYHREEIARFTHAVQLQKLRNE